MHITAADIIHRIGRMPIGDPLAMRSHALRLRADADAIMDLVQRAAQRAHVTVYQGPAADRFRAETDDLLRETQAGVTHLHLAANALTRAAGDVEVAQAAWHRSYVRVEAELSAAARAATRHR